MGLLEKWKSYVGPKDERIEAENNRIYKIGFIMVMGGYVVSLYYSMMLKQIAMLNELEASGQATLVFEAPGVLFNVFFIVTCLVCVVLQCRRGFTDSNRFGEAEVFPSGYYGLISGVAAVSTGLMAGLLRALAEFQLSSRYGISWAADVFVGVSLAVMLFVLLYGSFYLTFRAAKRRRETLERSFKDE